jgi:acetyl esterase/lipase
MDVSPFHPDLRRIAPWLPRSLGSPGLLRVVRILERLTPGARPRPGISIETAGDARVRVHHPTRTSTDPVPALLWIHGGGYILGSASQDDRLCREAADRLGMLVAAVDYRLAPEYPYPLPLEDCYDALVWLANRADVDASRVAIGGASAGGGLAAALALLARDRREVEPAFQLLSYPMLDDRTVQRTDIDERNFRLWNNRANRFGWTSYLAEPPGSPGISGLAAPSRCDDLDGLPPAWIGVGTLDLFYGEDLEYADRLRATGVACDVRVVDGAFHGFDSVSPKSGVTRDFRHAQLQALAGGLRVEVAPA